jgi:hypothetical protein
MADAMVLRRALARIARFAGFSLHGSRKMTLLLATPD